MEQTIDICSSMDESQKFVMQNNSDPKHINYMFPHNEVEIQAKLFMIIEIRRMVISSGKREAGTGMITF